MVAPLHFYRAEVLVLKSRDLNEADKLVTLFSREEGKIQAVARGARRPRNRLLAPIQPFSHSLLLLFPGRELDTIGQGEIKESFRFLREDLSRMAFSSYAAELVDEFTREKEKGPEIFQLLLEFFRFLGPGRTETDLARLARYRVGLAYFQLQLLACVGFRPELQRCVNCGEALENWAEKGPSVRLGLDTGGLLCPRCFGAAQRTVTLSVGALASLHFLLRAAWSHLHRLQLRAAQLVEVESFLAAYVEERLEKPLRSREFLRLVTEPGLISTPEGG